MPTFTFDIDPNPQHLDTSGPNPILNFEKIEIPGYGFLHISFGRTSIPIPPPYEQPGTPIDTPIDKIVKVKSSFDSEDFVSTSNSQEFEFIIFTRVSDNSDLFNAEFKCRLNNKGLKFGLYCKKEINWDGSFVTQHSPYFKLITDEHETNQTVKAYGFPIFNNLQHAIMICDKENSSISPYDHPGTFFTPIIFKIQS